MEAVIRKKFGYSSELIRGDNGVFNVFADGEQIWNKHEEGRFPEEKEILEALAAKTA